MMMFARLGLMAMLLSGCATNSLLPAVFDGPNLQTKIQGQGLPVVVLESGGGDGIASWTGLSERLAEKTTVFSYQRSRRGGELRTGSQVAEELLSTLRLKGLPPPYILVGHSIGGPFVLSFAQRYPDLVAGLVLVDGRPPGFKAACEAAGGNKCDVPSWMLMLEEPWVRAEVQALPATYAELGDLARVPAVPTVVISATEPPPLSNAAFMQAWLAQQRLTAQRLPMGRYVQAEGSGHYVHREQPDLVAREILALVRAATRIDSKLPNSPAIQTPGLKPETAPTHAPRSHEKRP